MAIKLYGIPISNCTARVMTCLYEKCVDFELVPVDFWGGEQKQRHFLEKNPFGQIPVLEDDGLTLFESRAITAYLAEKFKETGADLIRHRSLKEAASVKVWMEVESHQFNPAVYQIVYHYLMAPVQGHPPDQAIINASAEKLGKVLDVYEAKLSATKYLAGDFYSLADLHHLAFTYYLMKTPCASLINERPHVKAWWEIISSRPAFKKVAAGMTFG